MVCAFGLPPEAVSWIASKGGLALHRLRHSDEAAWSAATTPFGNVGGRRGRNASTAAAFAEKEEEPKADKDKDDDGGEKKEGGWSCFPAAASVYVKGRGPVRISDVRDRDLLLCGNAQTGRLLFSPFLGHLHVEATAVAEFVVVETTGGRAALWLSPEHLLFVSSSPDGAAIAKRAGELREGSYISCMGCDGDLGRMQVATVSKAMGEGLYAPLTECGTVVVNGTLCSCYADTFPTKAPVWIRRLTATHEASHSALLPLRLACRLGLRGAGGEEQREGIHPYCRALMTLPIAAQAIA